MKHLISALVSLTLLLSTLHAQEPAYVTFKASVNGSDEPLGNPINEPLMQLLDNNLVEVFPEANPPILTALR